MDAIASTMPIEVEGLRTCLKQNRRRSALIFLFMAITIAALTLATSYGALSPESYVFHALLGFLTLVCLGALGWYTLSRYEHWALSRFEEAARNALRSNSSADLDEQLANLERSVERRANLRTVLEALSQQLNQRRIQLLDNEILRDRRERIAKLCAEADEQVKAALKRRHEAHREVQARIQLEKAIPHLRHLAAEADRQFEEALSKKTITWWSRITRDRSPIVEIENQADALEIALARLRRSPNLIEADKEYDELKHLLNQRISVARTAAESAIPAGHSESYDTDRAITVGLLASAASIPVSGALDLHNASNVYDVLRDVNSNYGAMSDFEIWQETLVMPAESLVGLASLTKGAYFEKLVEHDFGGERFADFNHPDTDITIDGIDYQIKATDSVAYVESVAEHIPVIATSEVAAQAGVIDGGLTDVQLTETIDLALGGGVIDVGDTLLDGATTGLGAVGIVAIVRGTHSAWSSYNSGETALSALGVGLKVTGVSTARSAVNLAELVYRGTKATVTTSARLVSRDRTH